MALDPAEQHLRHVEKDVLIPKIMREKARERCSEQVQAPGVRRRYHCHLQTGLGAALALAGVVLIIARVEMKNK